MADIESLNFDIRLEARQAITTLEQLTLKAGTFGERVQMVQAELKKFSANTNMSFKSAKGVFQEVDKVLSDTGKGSVLFGERAKQGWAEVGNGAEKAANKMSFSAKAMSIAFGMLIHQGVNLLFNAFQKLFSLAIKGLNEMEAAMFNIANAEQRLSQQGLDVTVEGLQKIVKELQTLNPMLSKFQATELVSVISSKVAPALNLAEEDIARLANQIAILAVRNQALGKSFEEVEQQVVTGLLSGRVTSGINQLGVKITEQAVQEEVLRQNVGMTAEAYKKLTSAEKEHADVLAIISILEKNTSVEKGNIPEYLKTFSGMMGILKAKISDIMTTLGQVFGAGLRNVVGFLVESLSNASVWIEKNKDSLSLFGEVLGQVTVIVLKLLGVILKLGVAGAAAFRGLLDGAQKLIDKFPLLKKIFGMEEMQFTDTPTAAIVPDMEAGNRFGSGYKDAVKKTEKEVAEILKDAADKRLDIEQDYQEKRQDIARDYARKLEDIARKTSQDINDANRDYGDKVADINKDANDKIAEVNEEAHNNELEDEAQIQDELKNLREKYLMDLEDALHERDARQILRLMRQYQLDKQKALENRQKEREENQKQAAEKLADIEKERKDKLAEAKKELAEKLRDIRLNAARERQEAAIANRRALEDARIAYNRQLADHREYLQRKLRDLQQALMSEYQLTAAGANAINSLLNSLVGNVGGTSSINNPLPVGASLYTSGTPATSSAWATSGMYGTTGLAEGGSFLATKPTTINVAENRPELITATPLGRPGRDLNKLFSNAGIGGGASAGGMGQLELGITLSPDLEARVINQSMDAVGNVIMKINKSKV